MRELELARAITEIRARSERNKADLRALKERIKIEGIYPGTGLIEPINKPKQRRIG